MLHYELKNFHLKFVVKQQTVCCILRTHKMIWHIFNLPSYNLFLSFFSFFLSFCILYCASCKNTKCIGNTQVWSMLMSDPMKEQLIILKILNVKLQTEKLSSLQWLNNKLFAAFQELTKWSDTFLVYPAIIYISPPWHYIRLPLNKTDP